MCVSAHREAQRALVAPRPQKRFTRQALERPSIVKAGNGIPIGVLTQFASRGAEAVQNPHEGEKEQTSHDQVRSEVNGSRRHAQGHEVKDRQDEVGGRGPLQREDADEGDREPPDEREPLPSRADGRCSLLQTIGTIHTIQCLPANRARHAPCWERRPEAVMNRDYPLEKDALDDPFDEITQPGATLKGARIVVVDDDGDMRDLVTTRLASEGYDVRDAVSGGDLLRVIQSIAIDHWPLDGVDLIVVDNRMPGMSGLEAIRRLRAAHWETPAILMTAFPEAEVKREAANLRVPLISKPFSLDLLASAILLSLPSAPVRQARHAFRVPS